jgi:ribonuclease HI
MKSFTRLRLVYVPGHAGVPLNERADELARQAVSSLSNPGWREVHGGHEQAQA